jgi:hypothetical protein
VSRQPRSRALRCLESRKLSKINELYCRKIAKRRERVDEKGRKGADAEVKPFAFGER